MCPGEGTYSFLDGNGSKSTWTWSIAERPQRPWDTPDRSTSWIRAPGRPSSTRTRLASMHERLRQAGSQWRRTVKCWKNQISRCRLLDVGKDKIACTLFKAYLFKMNRTTVPRCVRYRHDCDDAEHNLFDCFYRRKKKTYKRNARGNARESCSTDGGRGRYIVSSRPNETTDVAILQRWPCGSGL